MERLLLPPVGARSIFPNTFPYGSATTRSWATLPVLTRQNVILPDFTWSELGSNLTLNWTVGPSLPAHAAPAPAPVREPPQAASASSALSRRAAPAAPASWPALPHQ